METQSVEAREGVVRVAVSLEGCKALSKKEEKWIREYLEDLLVDLVNDLDGLGVIELVPQIPTVE